MTYIKLLTVLTTLALLTACSGGGTPANNNASGDTKTGGDNNGGGGGNAGGGSGNTTDCTQTPFHNDCLTNNAPALALRQSMCLASATADPSCVGATGVITTFCEDDPFNTATACMADAYNDERLTICMGESTSSRCTPIVMPICELDFNNALCRGRMKYDEQLRCSVGEVCVVNTADWLAGFGNTPPNTAGNNARTETIEFLQGTADGLDIGNVTDQFKTILVLTLDLETATYNNVALGGEAKNGVAWFSADNVVGAVGQQVIVSRLYSGIFSGTSLGAPLTSADVSVSVPWTGTIGWTFYSSRGSSGFEDGKDFNLTVDFANSEIRAFVKRSNVTSNTEHFLLKAEFDDTGRFNGTIKHGAFAGNDKTATPTNVTTGVLTGLIGKQGAVGAFISNEADIATTNQSFIGGFGVVHPTITARVEAEVERQRIERERIENEMRIERERIASELLESQVTYTDWIGGFGVSPPPATPTSPAINQFLANPATAPTTLTSAIGGVGFFTENGAFYAGLLSNTNLGLPVAITPQVSDADVMATWPGKIRAIGVFDGNAGSGDTQTALDLNVVVNLTARTFTGTTVDPNADTTSITINGLFPATDNGVVTGTVTQRANVLVRNGQLTGIIGQNGVVGAFYSDSNVATEHRYVGGFYAAPTQ